MIWVRRSLKSLLSLAIKLYHKLEVENKLVLLIIILYTGTDIDNCQASTFDHMHINATYYF